ncbi:MAG: hydrogenase membrane subunit [Candidatus Aenigmarchaeota archaeon]|nr:hydrogenase membrane subunit [Candidatus Aenigmarchaeota archaeon]
MELDYLLPLSLMMLLGSVAVPLLFQRAIARRISLALVFAASAALAAFSLAVIHFNGTVSLALYKILPALTITLYVDRLAAFFMFTVALVSLAVSVYSMSYVEHMRPGARKNILVSAMGVFILSMLLVIASANSFSFLFFWEIMSLSSFVLVMTEYERGETVKAGIFYFIMTQLSTMFLLIAFLALFGISGTFDIQRVPLTQQVAAAVFLSLFAGFGIKAGAIPFHKWLPYAHPASPSNISALMSGVMLKVAIYGLMRFVLYVLSPELWWGVFILVAGTISAILGVIYALKEHDIKRLLAYHSIENIGIILIGFGLSVIFTDFGLGVLADISLLGALFHTLNHAIFKSLLFMTAGSVVNATGTRDIESMGGLIKRMPLTAALFLIGSVSISAMPPFNGFVSELMIFQSFFQSWTLGSNFVSVILVASLSVLALTSALAAACFVKAFGTIFLAVPRTEKTEKAKEAELPMLAGPAIMAVLCIAFGVLSYQIFSFAGVALPIPDMLLTGTLLLLSCGLTAAFVFFFASRKTRTGETWGCGILSQNGGMEYTASGFAEPIVTIFKPIYRTQKIAERAYFDKQNVLFKEGTAEIHLLKFFEGYMYMPVARFVSRVSQIVSKMQNGDLDTYVMYIFITVVALFVVLRWL